MNKEEVVSYLWKISDRNEVKEFWDILKVRNRQLEEQIAYEFNIGDNVYFMSKAGEKISGVIKKINQRSITVDTGDFSQWKVSPSLLTKVS